VHAMIGCRIWFWPGEWATMGGGGGGNLRLARFAFDGKPFSPLNSPLSLY